MGVQTVKAITKDNLKKYFFARQNDSNGQKAEVEAILAIERQTRDTFTQMETQNFITSMRRNNLMVATKAIDNATGKEVIIWKKGEKIKALVNMKDDPATTMYKLTYDDAKGIYFFHGKI